MTVHADTLLVNQPKDEGGGEHATTSRGQDLHLCVNIGKARHSWRYKSSRADVQINGKSSWVLKCFLHRMCLPAQGLAND